MAEAEDYKQQLIKLMPIGTAWAIEDTSVWVHLLDALAQEFARLDARALYLLAQIFPDTTTDLLPDWERVAGLPDACSFLGETIEIRRRNLLTKITSRGGQTKSYFIELAAQAGYDITITEFDSFRVNYSAIGDALNGEDWEYAWQVNSILNTVIPFVAGSNSAGDALRSWGNNRLECIISARKPSHTIVLFGYS